MSLLSENGAQNGTGGHSWWKFWKRSKEPDVSDYRRLAIQLHHSLPRTENSRSILVVTPKESGGYAQGALTLASCMAEALRRPVLLIDASRDGELSRLMDSSQAKGLADFLADTMQPLRELALQTSQQNVWFLPRGSLQGTGSVATSPEDAHDLLVRSAKNWDFVVVSGGPILQSNISLALVPFVGRVLLLVTENRTYREDIVAAQNTLERCKAGNISFVVTSRGASR
jgi:MinD-like ATPase involved in chromosome partitioning or flagellar assembly